MDISPSEKEEVLETFDLARRIDRVLEFLNQRLGVLRLSRELGEATRGTLEKRQREAILREQLATIRKELGEDEGTAAEVEDLKKAIAEAGMPEEVDAPRPTRSCAGWSACPRPRPSTACCAPISTR